MYGPGMSLKRLLQAAPDDAALQFLDPTVRDLCESVDPGLLTGDKLRAVLVRMLSVEAVVDDARLRSLVVKMLPEVKRKELAGRLGLAAGASSGEIVEAAGTANGKGAIKAFLGLDPDAVRSVAAPPAVQTADAGYALFDHQRRLARWAWDALERQPHKVLLHLPTGGGKTRTSMHLVCRHLRESEPTVVVWLAHSRELLDQAADEFLRAWAALGNRDVNLVRMWGDYRSDPLAVQDGILIASLQKLHFYKQRQLEQFLRLADRSSLTVTDEAHIALAPTYRGVMTALADKRVANRLLGLTATPGRTWADIDQDQQLADLFEQEKVMLEVDGYPDPVSYLIDSGYLARPHFRLLNAAPGLRMSGADRTALSEQLDVPESILARLGEDPARNLRILQEVEDLLARHQRVLVFCPSVSSARSVSTLLSIRGNSAFFVTGETPNAERRRVLARFKSDAPEPMAICNYGVLTTGFDAPGTSAALIARPTLSLVLYSQMVGRATRGIKAGGNAEAEIVTVVDPELPGFGKIEEAFRNWEDVWDGTTT